MKQESNLTMQHMNTTRMAYFGMLILLLLSVSCKKTTPPEAEKVDKVESKKDDEEEVVEPLSQEFTFGLKLDRDDWVYGIGDHATVSGTLQYKGEVLKDVIVDYEFGPEMLPATMQGSITAEEGLFRIPIGTMDKPGFLRLIVKTKYEGKDYREVITAAFSPYNIQPTVLMPSDFMSFWEDAIQDNRQIPLDPKMTLLADRSSSDINVYEVSFQSYEIGQRIYGILCIPTAPGSYPAIFNPPGAGVHKIKGDLSMAKKGFITLQIGIHGIPLNMAESEYVALANITLSRYRIDGMNNRDTYYFKRVYLGCVRAIDFIHTLPEFDGDNLASIGGSQGGALALVTTVLDSRIKFLSAYAPALSDLPGYLYDRAGGWPHMFKTHVNDSNRERALRSLQYYDVVNFAKHIEVPGLYSWGYNDETTPPTTMFALYNVITAPGELYIEKEMGHAYNTDQIDRREQWLIRKLKR